MDEIKIILLTAIGLYLIGIYFNVKSYYETKAQIKKERGED